MMNGLSGRIAIVASTAVVVSALCGCNVIDEAESTALPRASVRVNLADESSGVLDSADITVSRVTLHSGTPEAPPVELLASGEQPSSVGLLRLSGNIEAMLAESEVPAGRYESLSIVVDRATVRLAPGLSFPDGSRTREIRPDANGDGAFEVRLARPLTARSGVMTLVVLDFPASESFPLELDLVEPNVVRDLRFRPKLVETRRHDVPLG